MNRNQLRTDALNCTQVLLSLESGASRRLRGKVAWAALCGAAQRCPSATAKVAGSQGRQKMPQLLWPWSFCVDYSDYRLDLTGVLRSLRCQTHGTGLFSVVFGDTFLQGWAMRARWNLLA